MGNMFWWDEFSFFSSFSLRDEIGLLFVCCSSRVDEGTDTELCVRFFAYMWAMPSPFLRVTCMDLLGPVQARPIPLFSTPLCPTLLCPSHGRCVIFPSKQHTTTDDTYTKCRHRCLFSPPSPFRQKESLSFRHSICFLEIRCIFGLDNGRISRTRNSFDDLNYRFRCTFNGHREHIRLHIPFLA